MPVTLKQVVERVAELEPGADRELLGRRVREVIAALGLSVANDGEVYSEAPKPAYMAPEDNSRYPRARRYR